MIKKFFVTLLATATLLTSCSSDDDSKELTIEQRNSLDDQAIDELLDQYYFGLNGKLTKFDTIKGNEDDKFPKLRKYAVKDPAGYYYAVNPEVTAKGSKIKSNDTSSILISYEMKYFISNDDESIKTKIGSLYGYDSTIDGKGTATTDPDFFYFKPTDTEEAKGVKREHREFKNLIDGLKKFSATNTNGADLYNFQGVIILPSRLAFGREKYYTGSNLSNRYLRDYNFVLNFELHQVKDRK